MLQACTLRFADAESVRGIAAIVAFALGSCLGGKRAGSLTALRLRHVKLSVVSVFVAGEKVAVPSADCSAHNFYG